MQKKPNNIRDFEKELSYYYHFNPELGESYESFSHLALIRILREFDQRLTKLEESQSKTSCSTPVPN
jgi:hypothetical protein